MQEIILKVKYFERGLSKSLKKGNFIFSFEPSPFNRQNYQKQKGPGDQSLFSLWNKFRDTQTDHLELQTDCQYDFEKGKHHEKHLHINIEASFLCLWLYC